MKTQTRIWLKTPGIECFLILAFFGGTRLVSAQAGEQLHSVTGSQSALTRSATVTRNRASDDREIYAVLIAAHLPQQGKPSLIDRETIHGQRLQSLMKEPLLAIPRNNRMLRKAVQDARRQGQTAIPLAPLIALPGSRFAALRELETGNGTDFWKLFHRKYPQAGGYAAFAAPGYSQDGKTALALMEWHNNPQGGEGLYLLLVKEQGRWRIKRNVGGWEN